MIFLSVSFVSFETEACFVSTLQEIRTTMGKASALQIKCKTCSFRPRKKYISSNGQCFKCLHVCKKCWLSNCICLTRQERWRQKKFMQFIINRAKLGDLSDRDVNFIDRFVELFNQSCGSVVVPVYFTADECRQLKMFNGRIEKAEKEPINFKGFETITNRFQTLVYKYNKYGRYCGIDESLPDFYKHFMRLLLALHPGTTSMVVKILESVYPCERQYLHVDDKDFKRRKLGRNKNYKPPSEMSLNIVIALEPNENPSHLIVGKKKSLEEIALIDNDDLEPKYLYNEQDYTLTQGSMIIFTGDFVHAGAAFTSDIARRFGVNWRMHFSIGTKSFGNKGEEVGVLSNRNDNTQEEEITEITDNI